MGKKEKIDFDIDNQKRILIEDVKYTLGHIEEAIRNDERKNTAEAVFADIEKAGFVLNTDLEYLEIRKKYCD